MSEIKGNKKIVGKINAKTIRATANVPDWLQPLIKENGVYVGTEEPTDPEKLVWINPDGQGDIQDLSNYYNKDETDSLIETAVQNIDLSSYATKVELENYDTSEQVDAKINAIEIPEIDLSDYAKKSDIPDVSGFITEIPSEYVTETELSAKGYLTEIPSEYITETELNAKGYLTEHQSLEGYAKKSDIPDVSGFVDANFVLERDGLYPISIPYGSILSEEQQAVVNIDPKRIVIIFSGSPFENYMYDSEDDNYWHYKVNYGLNECRAGKVLGANGFFRASINKTTYKVFCINNTENRRPGDAAVFAFPYAPGVKDYSTVKTKGTYSWTCDYDPSKAQFSKYVFNWKPTVTEEQVNTLINTALGVIENGTY